MSGSYIGELAALGVAAFWAASCQLHSAAGKYLGSNGVTVMRLPFSIAVMLFIFLVSGSAADFSPPILLLLFLSSLFGIVICDTAFYHAIAIIGPRLATLTQSLSSCITALLAFVFLDETIGLTGCAGMAIAVSGVLFVLGDGASRTAIKEKQLGRAEMVKGCLIALLSAFGLALSFLFLKEAMRNGANPAWAGFLRVIFGAALLAGIGAARGWLKPVWSVFISTPPCWKLMLLGGVFGTTGIWLSSVAVNNTATGIAATIIALEPVLIIPINALWEKRAPSLRAVTGTCVAFAGVAILLSR